MQEATVGRIVHYTPADANLAGRKGQPYPAMVTHVWGECVNLAIFNDGSFPLSPDGTVVHETSVPYSEAGDPFTWRWPERK